MKRFLLLTSAICGLTLAPATAAASPKSAHARDTTAAPARKVKGRVLTSAAMPAVRIEFGKGFKYAGGHSFILYDVARAEQHFFVDADKQGRVRRMYWVQFEGYLPTNSHAYKYKVTKTVNVGGLDFVADAYPRNIKTNPNRPDSDGARARDFLAAKGYRMASDDVLSQRLVHLIGEPKRDELMIIYLEDLGAAGLTAADYAPGGREAASWGAASSALLERATKGLKISR